MFLGEAINVFLGLALTFGVVAGLASAVTEAFASILDLRAKSLKSGLTDILNDPSLVTAVLNHGAANPLAPGPATAGAALTDPKELPSYIAAPQFASALLDVLKARGGDLLALSKATIDGLQNPQLQQLLNGMLLRAQPNGPTMEEQVAEWFDSSMDRVSGAYKRQSQLISFLIAISLAAALNVDPFHLASALWGHSAVVAQALGNINSATPPSNAVAALASDFPIGWPEVGDSLLDWVARIGGWVSTGFAALFGAPFWFDTIQRFAQIKGTGPAPSRV